MIAPPLARAESRAAVGIRSARGAGKKLVFTALDLLGVPALTLRLRPHASAILLYHGVCPPRNGGGIFNYRKKFIAPESLARQLAWLKRRFTIMPLPAFIRQLRERGTPPERALAVTFDDGYENLYTHAFPILRTLGIPATVFIATDLIEPAEPLWFDRLEYAIGMSPKRDTAP